MQGESHHVRGEQAQHLVRGAVIKMQTEHQNERSRDFPGGAVVKNPPANAGDTDSIPGLGRSHIPRSN